jgi:hypothetical protein
MNIIQKYFFKSLLKHSLLTHEEGESEHLLNWLAQVDDTAIEKEIINTLIRLNIDASAFKIFFIKKLEEHQILEIRSHCPKNKNKIKIIVVSENNGDQSKSNPHQECEQEKVETSGYWGQIIAKMLIKNSYKKNFLSKYFMKISLTIGLFHGLVPFAIRYYENKSFFGNSSGENVVIICIFISDVLFYFVNTSFLMAGIVAYRRKLKLLGHLSNLISPKKVEVFDSMKVRKIFPTLNFFNKVKQKKNP